MKALTFEQINNSYNKNCDIIENLKKKKTDIKLPIYIAIYESNLLDTEFLMGKIYKITNLKYKLISSKYSILHPLYDVFSDGIYATQNEADFFKEKRLFDRDFFETKAGKKYEFLVLSNEEDFKEMCIKLKNNMQIVFNNILNKL